MKRDVFQAIADPTRRAIIALIAMQAMTPNAIAEHFDTSRQAVSKHLRIFTECEFVRQEQKTRGHRKLRVKPAILRFLPVRQRPWLWRAFWRNHSPAHSFYKAHNEVSRDGNKGFTKP